MPTPPTRTQEPEGHRPLETVAGLSLVISGRTGLERVALADQSRIVLGRDPDCDVVLSDSSVSRRHAAIVCDGGMFIEDLGSSNGTRVIGRRLLAVERVPITTGMVLELGSVTVLLQRRLTDVEEPPARSRRGHAAAGPIVEDPSMKRLYAMLDIIAPSPLSVIVLGETGTGKEVFAETLHARSGRAAQLLLPINCAALPESILEAELFGYEKGAFTGAAHAKQGLFEAADGGTVFLDEIGELPLVTQAKLLRVVENGEVMRLGSVKPKRVDVRIVAATNRDLAALAAEGKFRSDLYFRLNGYSVTLPPLRERKAEILPLARLFCERAARRFERPAPRFSESSERALSEHSWPGNVRELRNAIERAVTLCQKAPAIGVEHLMLPAIRPPLEARDDPNPVQASGATAPPPAPGGDGGLRATMSSFERQRLVEALARTSGNQTEAAKALGISRRAFIDKLDAYAIDRPRKGARK